MSKNKLYNQSYFVKRLIDAGFNVTRLNIKFESDDIRRWVIIVNPNISYKYNIFITCFRYYEKNKIKFCFNFQGQNIKNFILKTLSMSTIILILNKTFMKN